MPTDDKSLKSELPPLQTDVAPTVQCRKPNVSSRQAATIKATSTTLPHSKPTLSLTQMLAHAYGTWENLPSTPPPGGYHPHKSRRAKTAEVGANSDGRSSTLSTKTRKAYKPRESGTPSPPFIPSLKGQLPHNSHPGTPKCLHNSRPNPALTSGGTGTSSISSASAIETIKSKTKTKGTGSSKTTIPPHLRWVPGQRSIRIHDPDYPFPKQCTSPWSSPAGSGQGSQISVTLEVQTSEGSDSLQNQDNPAMKLYRPLALAELDCFTQSFESSESLWGTRMDYQPSRECDTPSSRTSNIGSEGTRSQKDTPEYMSVYASDITSNKVAALQSPPSVVSGGMAVNVRDQTSLGHCVVTPATSAPLPTSSRSDNNRLSLQNKSTTNLSQYAHSTCSTSPRSSLYESAVECLSAYT